MPSFSFHRVATTVKAGLLAVLMLAGFAPGSALAQGSRFGTGQAFPNGTTDRPTQGSLRPGPVHADPANSPSHSANPNAIGPQRPQPTHPASNSSVPSPVVAQVQQNRPANTPVATVNVNRPTNNNHGTPPRTPQAPVVLTYTPGKVTQPQLVVVNRPGQPAPVVLTNPSHVTSPQVVVVNHGSAFPQSNHNDFTPHFGPPHDIHVVADVHNRPHYYYGPNHEEFHFVRSYPVPFYIQNRESLRDLLLRPLASSVAWGIGQIVTDELANALGLPLYTSLYALSPDVMVVSALPTGYVIGEAIPANVALVTAGPSGEVVVCNRVTTGSYVAYRTTTTGLIINEVVVVPSPSVAVTASTTPAPIAVASETPAPAPTPAPSPSVPVSPKIGKVVYDANQNPIGVIVLSNDGSQEFIPLLAQNDAPKSP